MFCYQKPYQGYHPPYKFWALCRQYVTSGQNKTLAFVVGITVSVCCCCLSHFFVARHFMIIYLIIFLLKCKLCHILLVDFPPTDLFSCFAPFSLLVLVFGEKFAMECHGIWKIVAGNGNVLHNICASAEFVLISRIPTHSSPNTCASVRK